MAQVFKNASNPSIGTSYATLITATVPTIVHALRIANIDGVDQGSVTISLHDDSEVTDTVLALDIPVPGKSVFKFDGQITLEVGDYLEIKADVAARLSANSSHVEIT